MAISKANFNSFNVTPTASKFITFNSSNNGLAADDVGGSLVLISTQTASSSANISFTSGIDSTYKEYIFKFINCHPATSGATLALAFSTDGGSNYGVTKTTTVFEAYHSESGSNGTLSYDGGVDRAQDTTGQGLNPLGVTNDSDGSSSGTLHLFDPSNTTFVKHFLVQNMSLSQNTSAQCVHAFLGGYLNTTSAVDAVRFSMNTGNLDSGVIKLYGVK